MIYQTHVSNKHGACPLDLTCRLESHGSLRRDAGAQETVDLRPCQRPIIVEVGNDSLHERFRERDGALLVAQVIVEDRQRQLLRAFTFVGPFEAVFGEAFDLVCSLSGRPSTVTISPSMV